MLQTQGGLGASPSGAQGALLAEFGGTQVPGIKPRLAGCKASATPCCPMAPVHELTNLGLSLTF